MENTQTTSNTLQATINLSGMIVSRPITHDIRQCEKQNDTKNILVTVDVAGENTKVRSSYNCQDVGDVALFTDPEEFYIMKRSGNVVMYDANTKTETLKIANENPHPPALQAAEALAGNPLQGPLDPPAIGPGLGDGHGGAAHTDGRPQRLLAEQTHHVSGRTE